MKELWFVYICEANTGRYYTGIAKNPMLRLARHNRDDGAQFAHDQGPLKLVYVSSSFTNKSNARKREVQIKGWTHLKKQKLISGEWV